MANPYILAPQLSSGKLNNEDNTVPGKTATGAPVSLPGYNYAGLLGKLLTIDDAEALKLSLTTVGTLRAGTYMMVQTKAGSTAAPARGIGAFWDTSANNGLGKYVVTPDMAATSSLAGIYINAPTKGNYCWIQTFGLGTLQCRSSVTTTTIGDIAVFTGLTTNTFDSIADATDYFSTAGAMKNLIGQWYEAPANSGLKLAWLNGFAMRRYA